jgi:predicted RNA binding protein YcfA (HicA-like mRNA interferase family)
MKKRKLLQSILQNRNNVRFQDMVSLILAFGFRLDRMSGSHNIFVHDTVTEIVNLQNVKGEAKPYQIKQFLTLVEKYDLRLEDDE